MSGVSRGTIRTYHSVRYLLPLGAGLAISSMRAIGILMDGKSVDAVGFLGGHAVLCRLRLEPLPLCRMALA